MSGHSSCTTIRVVEPPARRIAISTDHTTARGTRSNLRHSPPVSLDGKPRFVHNTYGSVGCLMARTGLLWFNGWTDVADDRGEQGRDEPRGAAHRPRRGPVVRHARL